jgi:hypothetical protein
MAMTKVISLKVPDESAGLQSRLTSVAKKAQIPVWKLISRMLDAWEKDGSSEPTGDGWEEWRADIERKVEALQADLEAAKAQGYNGLSVNQVNQSSEYDIDFALSPARPPVLEVPGAVTTTEEPKTGATEAQSETKTEAVKAQEDIDLPENQVNHTPQAEPTTAIVTEEPKPQRGRKKKAEVSKPEMSIESKVSAFEAAFSKLERDKHVMVWELRDALGWSREQFDATVIFLRNKGFFQPMEGAEFGRMTDEQLNGAFYDENGKRHLIIMRTTAADVPSEATAEPAEEAPAEPKKSKPRAGRPKKAQSV